MDFTLFVLKIIKKMQRECGVNKERKWRRGASIRLPLACDASALPSELHPLKNQFSDSTYQYTVFIGFAENGD